MYFKWISILWLFEKSMLEFFLGSESKAFFVPMTWKRTVVEVPAPTKQNSLFVRRENSYKKGCIMLKKLHPLLFIDTYWKFRKTNSRRYIMCFSVGNIDICDNPRCGRSWTNLKTKKKMHSEWCCWKKYCSRKLYLVARLCSLYWLHFSWRKKKVTFFQAMKSEIGIKTFLVLLLPPSEQIPQQSRKSNNLYSGWIFFFIRVICLLKENGG